MHNIYIKHITDIDMFWCIHEGGLVNGNNGVIKYIGGPTLCIEIDKHKSHDKRKRKRTLIKASQTPNEISNSSTPTVLTDDNHEQ